MRNFEPCPRICGRICDYLVSEFVHPTVEQSLGRGEAGGVVDPFANARIRKNEAIFVLEDAFGIDILAFLLIEIKKPRRFLKGGRATRFGFRVLLVVGGLLPVGFGFLARILAGAGCLQVAELAQFGLHLAKEAHFVNGEQVETLRVVDESARRGEGGVEFAGVTLSLRGAFRATVAFLKPGVGGEHIVFYDGDAIDAPLRFGDGMGELAFERAERVEFVGDFGDESVASLFLLIRHDVEVTGEAMLVSVEAGGGAALGGAGPGGELGVAAVGFNLLVGGHVEEVLSLSGIAWRTGKNRGERGGGRWKFRPKTRVMRGMAEVRIFRERA